MIFLSLNTIGGKLDITIKESRMDINIWRKRVGKYFPEFVLPAEIGLSVICQLRILDIANPFGLVYVDVPSSGKTIILNFFSDLEELAYPTDTFTAASFVSNASNVPLNTLKDIDLLPKIKNKVLIVRDLAPIFGMRDDDLLKTMGVLTRVFDGEGLITNSGIHGRRGYEGKYLFMFLAASTPIQSRVWKVIGNFGSRLFFYNLNTPDKDPKTLADQLSANLSPKSKEKRCRQYTKEFISELFQDNLKVRWGKSKDDKKLLQEIGTISKLLACLRGIIRVSLDAEGEDVEKYSIPQIEKPDRINQSFYNFSRGHALLCGRENINDSDIAILIKIAFSSAAKGRTDLFNHLIKYDEWFFVDDIKDALNYSRPSVIHSIRTLQHLGIVKVERRPRTGLAVKIADQFFWFQSDRFKKLNSIYAQSQKRFIKQI